MIRQFTSLAQKLGEQGEVVACGYLKREGFTIIERNVANKYGEIDIVARKSGRYYFYEVKAGKQGSWFNPAENMTKGKIRKFLVSIEHYCLLHKIKNYRVYALIVKLPILETGQSRVELLPLE